MKKALVPMVLSLALCGVATTALVVSSARAQVAPRKPMMVALVTPGATLMADNTPTPPPAGGTRDRGARGHGDMAANLKQMCQDGYAHQVGEMAYLEAKLSLSGSEQPLFARWRDAKLEIARRHQADCATRDMTKARDGDKMPSMLDGMAHEETMLKQRLADLQAERPALEAFYNALTPAQKMEFGHPGMGPMGGMKRRMFDGPMGRGMAPGMADDHPPANAPPPPQ